MPSVINRPISYPIKERTPEEALGRETLLMVTSNLLSWRQGPGSFGGFHLHACWDTDSSLSRRYHGSSISRTTVLYEGVQELLSHSPSAEWQYLADQLIAQILWQQSPEGGFFYAGPENEPAYTPEMSCPIHQMNPLRALLYHYQNTPSGNPVRGEIEQVLERHIRYFNTIRWRDGNGWLRPLPYPGWCGVTNQDLVAVASLALYAKTMDDWEPYNEFGLPALDTYLGSHFYDENTGLFERGDQPRFTERCSYMCIIAKMLLLINDIHPDKRIPPILERVGEVLTEAVYVDAYGNMQMSVGIDDEQTRLSGKKIWLRNKIQIGDYPEMIHTMHLLEPYFGELREAGRALECSLAQYVFSDGFIPTTLDATKPLFAIATGLNYFVNFWKYLIWKNPGGIDFSEIPILPVVRRRCADMELISSAEGWQLSQNNHEVFHATKRIPLGIVPHGETLANDPFQAPDKFDFDEVVEIGGNV